MLNTPDSPCSRGRTPEKGETVYLLSLPLDNDEHLQVKMGAESKKMVLESIGIEQRGGMAWEETEPPYATYETDSQEFFLNVLRRPDNSPAFLVLMRCVEDSVMFLVYIIIGKNSAGRFVYASERKNGTSKIERAGVYFEGRVDPSGCVEYNFEAIMHVCGRTEISELGELLIAIHDMATTLLPKKRGK